MVTSSKPRLDQGAVTSAPSEPSPSGILGAIQSIADIAARIEAAVGQIEAAGVKASNSVLTAQNEAITVINKARDEALNTIHSTRLQTADSPAIERPLAYLTEY